MSKIIKLNEAKIVDIIKNVNKQLLKENSGDDFKDFEVDVDLDVEYSYTLADGSQLEEIIHPKTIRIKFDLEIYVRKRGIESIMVKNLRGPKELEVELVFENQKEDSDEWFEEVPHTIAIDWSNVERYSSSSSYSGYDTGVESITLSLDKGLFLEKIYYVSLNAGDD